MKKGYIKDVPSQLPSTLLRYILEEPPQSILWRMTLTQLNACNNITTEQFLMFFLIWGDGLTSSRSLRKSSSTPTEMMLFMIVDEKLNDLDALIEFFEVRERYEDCAYLMKIRDKIVANEEFKTK